MDSRAGGQPHTQIADGRRDPVGPKGIVALFVIILVLAIAVPLGVWLSLRPTAQGPQSRQGIFGTVTLLDGDCMPPTTPEMCRSNPVSRTVFVRQVVPWREMEGGYYGGPAPPIAVGQSLLDGSYIIPLLPGNYSVFVEDASRQYCNLISVVDGEERACFVAVLMGDSIRFDFTIDHATR